jgi:hypothetical protein
MTEIQLAVLQQSVVLGTIAVQYIMEIRRLVKQIFQMVVAILLMEVTVVVSEMLVVVLVHLVAHRIPILVLGMVVDQHVVVVIVIV